ncbi:GFA family protein [Methylobacterium sp. NEAU K]|uniref:GFA family protein n=1 Tax=Methylobacterium sp. NEAU K TaxID=3064946 RepID=UPI00273724FC|nr:GFA family protein [Methylobacterium sp. NEAU K]MDP4006296.1 GFA family protein [Methylobacterium sp. NEAU K]
MTGDRRVRNGQCHCGAVRFEVTLINGFTSIRRCTCSYCRMRGAIVAMAAWGGLSFERGENALTRYRFHTGSAEHFFCSRCGICAHHQRRSERNLYAVNVACLDGVSPFDFPEVPVMDGINHTNDTGKPTRRAGTLRFIPADEPSRSDDGRSANLLRTGEGRPA